MKTSSLALKIGMVVTVGLVAAMTSHAQVNFNLNPFNPGTSKDVQDLFRGKTKQNQGANAKDEDPDQAIARAKQELESKGGLVNNSAALGYVQRVMSKVTPSTASKKIQVRILRDGRLETTSLPDGTIYVTTGLLVELSNEAELAAALAHAGVMADLKARDYEKLKTKKRNNDWWKALVVAGVGTGAGLAVANDNGAAAGVLVGALPAGGAAWMTEYFVANNDSKAKNTEFYKRLEPADKEAFERPHSRAMAWMKMGGYAPGQFLAYAATHHPGDVENHQQVQAEFRANYQKVDPLQGLNPNTYRQAILTASL